LTAKAVITVFAVSLFGQNGNWGAGKLG